MGVLCIHSVRLGIYVHRYPIIVHIVPAPGLKAKKLKSSYVVDV